MDPTVHPDGGCGGPLGRANGWISAIAAALRRRPVSSAGGPTAARRRAGSRNSSGRRATAGAGNAASLPTAITTGLSRSVVPSASDGNAPPKVGFAEDSPLEGDEFELSVRTPTGYSRDPPHTAICPSTTQRGSATPADAREFNSARALFSQIRRSMASTLRIIIEPLLRSIRPRRCQFWKILFTLSRLPPAMLPSSRCETCNSTEGP
jgi:hypothetical protein